MTECDVALIVFNRPRLTAKALERIRSARPARLFVIGDAARDGVAGDEQRCAEVRSLVERVDWTDLHLEFAHRNLGCFRRISSGLDWAFAHSSKLIVLEDDCAVDSSFFRYASELLDRFEREPKVMSITAMSPHFRRRTGADYYYSRYSHPWGWATWADRWKLFDRSMARWPEEKRDGWLESILETSQAIDYWTSIFDATREEVLDSWFFRWLYTIWKHGGLTAVPTVNLVTNNGFADDSTHTRWKGSPWAEMPVFPLRFPLRHPDSFERDEEADRMTQRMLFARDRQALVRAWLRRFIASASLSR